MNNLAVALLLCFALGVEWPPGQWVVLESVMEAPGQVRTWYLDTTRCVVVERFPDPLYVREEL